MLLDKFSMIFRLIFSVNTPVINWTDNYAISPAELNPQGRGQGPQALID
jgi:hypothetical protein